MTLKQFIKDNRDVDSPIGDLANDCFRDINFPWDKSEKEILDYLDFQTSWHDTNDVFIKFKEAFLAQR